MYRVELYAAVRRSVYVEGLKPRVASSFYSRSTRAMRLIAGARDDTKRGVAPSA